MSVNAKRDIVAIILVVLVIASLILVTWVNKPLNDTSLLTGGFVDKSEQFIIFVRNYDSLTPLELMNAELDPQTFIKAAAIAPDQGTANELLYIADLIERYNDGADIEVLQEAAAILNEILPHIRQSEEKWNATYHLLFKVKQYLDQRYAPYLIFQAYS